MHEISYTKKAQKHIPKLKAVRLDKKVKELLVILEENPFKIPPPYESLLGNFKGLYSRRINLKHRLVYEVIEDKKAVKIISMWSHYEF